MSCKYIPSWNSTEILSTCVSYNCRCFHHQESSRHCARHRVRWRNIHVSYHMGTLYTVLLLHSYWGIVEGIRILLSPVQHFRTKKKILQLQVVETVKNVWKNNLPITELVKKKDFPLSHRYTGTQINLIKCSDGRMKKVRFPQFHEWDKAFRPVSASYSHYRYFF